MKIEFSGIGPSISKQCEAARVIATGIDMVLFERISKAITVCYIHGVINAKDRDRARASLIRRAKFKDIQ